MCRDERRMVFLKRPESTINTDAAYLLPSLGDHLVHSPGELIDCRGIARLAESADLKLAAVRILVEVEHPDRRVAGDLECFLEVEVLLLVFGRDLFAAREIELEQHNVLLGPLLEFGLGKDGGGQPFAPATPVTPGEVGHDRLVFFLRFLVRLFEVDKPSFIAGAVLRILGMGKPGCEDDQRTDEQVFHKRFLSNSGAKVRRNRLPGEMWRPLTLL